MKHQANETFFVRSIQALLCIVGNAVCRYPWAFIISSIAISAGFSLLIPFKEMENNISDFTPYGARARQELKVYEHFFSDRGEPKVVYAFIRPAAGSSSLLSLEALNQTVQVLDKINYDFLLRTPKGRKNFQQFCKGFCQMNEPVRNFAKGFFLNNGSINGSDHVDLGYPVTTVLGRKLYMDPNFFGVKISVLGEEGKELVVDVAEALASINEGLQTPNNVRSLSLIVLHFRAEIGPEIDPDDLKRYERDIVKYFEAVPFSAIDVNILTDNFITLEIVRAGLTLLPFLAIGFSIMATFTTTTFYFSAKALRQWHYSKIILAVMACVTPFMACGTTMGILFALNFRFGSILCVTPFLVLAISVDDCFLMVNAWQRITHKRRKQNAYSLDQQADLESRVREMLIETGPSVTITSLTNLLAFGVGALTPTPEIQLFSIGNALAVTIDFVYQLTFYAALMSVSGRWEISAEKNLQDFDSLEKKRKRSDSSLSQTSGTSGLNRLIETYCRVLTDKYTILSLVALLAAYWYLSISGALSIKAELDPQKLFLQSSSMQKIFDSRSKYIAPNYATCWILVNSPGNIRNANDRQLLHSMVEEFERLPQSLGAYATKFFLRDFEEFELQSELTEFEDESQQPQQDDFAKFLEWPEFSFWQGFLQTKNTSQGLIVERFFLTTAFHGAEFVDWSSRAKLLNLWRSVADKYPSLKITVYEDDARFLDLIETLVPTTWQSALLTLACMFFVAMLFIGQPTTLLVATFSIFSTCLGVFGIISWWGADLDPIFMSAVVMSIGFSVDIPAHIAYHYFQTTKESNNVQHRIQHTIAAVGLPILQASISTILCVLSLFLVNLHMSQIFAKTMFLVVLIGALHGLIVMPALFTILSWRPSKLKPTAPSPQSTPTEGPHILRITRY